MVKKRGVETRFPSVGFAISCIDQGTHWYLLCGLFAHAFVKKKGPWVCLYKMCATRLVTQDVFPSEQLLFGE